MINTNDMFVSKDNKGALFFAQLEGKNLNFSYQNMFAREAGSFPCDDLLNTYEEVTKDDCNVKKFIFDVANERLDLGIDKKDMVKYSISAGEYYPRIWRGYINKENPSYSYDKLLPSLIYGKEFFDAIVASESLFKQVEELFLYVEPDLMNYKTYSHKLRELLILLCTEIEANLAAILNSHGYKNKRPTTSDYVKIRKPLLLNEYKVKLKNYPKHVFCPFEKWNNNCATESISWYKAYNSVKHDRFGKFSEATFEQVLNAAAALFILQVAQWGPSIFEPIKDNRFSIFKISFLPEMPLNELTLMSPSKKYEFTKLQYSF